MIHSYATELWSILSELSPPLLLGLFIAGLMHGFLPAGLIHQKLSTPNLHSVFRSSLIGIPLPLCSCGVLPTALSLKREGASNGATTAFLISTPQTGVDSILVTASFLGWPFALFKVAAAFITGLIGGLIADRAAPAAPPAPPPTRNDASQRPVHFRLLDSLHYAVYDLLAAIDRWILLGVLLAAAISTLVPPDFLEDLRWAQGITGMFLMLAVALPLYVCATGSIPIAASLVAAGMPAGTAMVFLMAGPATNIATFGAIHRTLGPRVLAVYLGTVVVMSIGFGLTFDFLIGPSAVAPAHHHGPDFLGTVSASVLIAAMGYLLVRRLRARVHARSISQEDSGVDLTLKVDGMNCQHCVASVKNSIERVPGVEEAVPDLATGQVQIRGQALDLKALRAAVEGAGYQLKGET